jgi:23S rRNA (guanosine2251-2'-O)-methyltransferase
MSETTETLVGRNAVREALLAHRRRVSRVVLAEGVEEKGPIEQIAHLCRERAIPLVRQKRWELDRLGGQVEHQGVAAQVSLYPYVTLEDLFVLAEQRAEAPFLLVLDSLQDPQNVGSVLRTAEAVGVQGVILPTRHAVGITPAVSRASAGAVEHLLIDQETNLARALDTLKDKGVWIVGVEEHPSAQDYRSLDLNMPIALVLGSEGFGLRRLLAEKCDFLVRIPMRGHINSLNVSVAGSVLLYQAWHARQGPMPTMQTPTPPASR